MLVLQWAGHSIMNGVKSLLRDFIDEMDFREGWVQISYLHTSKIFQLRSEVKLVFPKKQGL